MSRLTLQQLQAVTLIANGKSHNEVAANIGVTRRTIIRWTQRTDFAQAVTDIHTSATKKTIEVTAEDIAKHSQEFAQRLVPKALTVLREYLDSPTAKGCDRLRACQIIGNWAGMTQSQTKQEPQLRPEEQLRDYLTFIAGKNGNGHSKVGG